MAEQGCVWLFGRGLKSRGLSRQPIGCMPVLSVTHSAAAAAIDACGVTATPSRGSGRQGKGVSRPPEIWS